MTKFIDYKIVSLNENQTLDNVIELVPKEGETIKLDMIKISSTGEAEIEIWKNQTLHCKINTTILPSDEYPIKPEIQIQVGEKIQINVKDLSGASNTIKIYYEYERITK